MENNYLRIAIALARGWKIIQINDDDPRVWASLNSIGHMASTAMDALQVEGECLGIKTNWPMDISAAFELFTEMGHGAYIWHEINGYGDKWHCSFDLPTWYSEDTAARAICLAYLQFVQERAK